MAADYRLPSMPWVSTDPVAESSWGLVVLREGRGAIHMVLERDSFIAALF